MPQDIQTKIVSAVAGVLIGWVGQSLDLSSRVDAIEASQARIEARLDHLIGGKK
ncbi:MAG: hypothetical protein WAQ08_05910 [Aquabacterium sp.]|jgi:hypothetical protein|uniref:hypothetical protein n=1 Tax=Aquabacterium sp. TaxID=1872578 RepID=UPI003BB0E47D